MTLAETPGQIGGSPVMRTALEDRDLDTLMDALSADVVLHSPITTGFVFAGREQIRTLYAAVFESVEDFHVTEEIAEGSKRVLVLAGHIGGQEFEEVQLLSLDAEGRVRELTLFFRPMPALPALAAMLADTWIAPRFRFRATLLKLLVFPLVLMTRYGDRIVVRLVASMRGLTSAARS